MNRILILLTSLLVVGESFALPPCPTGVFHNCYGTFTYADGRKYVGEFKDDKMHGQGTMTHANGTEYVGGFKYDKGNGQGTLTIAYGGKYLGEYVGEFKDNKMHGQGMLTVADGGKFVGEWKSTQPWAGVEYGPSGEVIAIYKEGVPQ